ncbi:aminotransferase class V-fold PLP-dependent enzyme [Bdellovibrio bacteriovorus]|uniref:aminotransferase class V-fold PLP-dependent enzyme n=1 Tax=Bdellovibrio bacteriovorus TaxID=959 RepID=UPI0021CF08A6|nr:aminotransferase class V-fold PLP-dependent enzyme [Bdellovibrio bacteriovorus]UXR64556.1 aminotransferase class V-fold PLP-dependent enzyme [Bdellovibrio bacteriovorus]
MYKHLYQRFLAAHTSELHFACHSHHYWPDCSREAHLQYWDDSCKYVDDKWGYIFSTKIPQAQKLIAEQLKISCPEQIVFAPNTHEFVFRLLSSLNWKKSLKILTTDSEFYSFDRQINRLSEMAEFEVVKIPTLPFETFHERFEAALLSESWDLVFFSQVFFNSGLVADIPRLVAKAPASAIVVVDGYHAFMAVPTDLSSVQERIFYLAGSYKYAQGGEGACFLYVPSSTRHRPLFTGWFAELSHLSAVGNEVGYPTDALQYAGSTMDFSGLYRLIATLETFKKEGLTTEAIHQWVHRNQMLFLQKLSGKSHPLLQRSKVLMHNPDHHGHFLTFELPSTEDTQKMVKELASKGIKTDSRGNRLRFGFGLYHDEQDIQELIRRI